MSEEAPKPLSWYNKGTVAGALSALSGLAILVGVSFTSEDAALVTEAIDKVVTMGLGLSAAVSGLVAAFHALDKKIKFPWEK